MVQLFRKRYTSKEFIINGTKCEVKYGRINEVGNTHVVPNSIYEKALKRKKWQNF